MINNLKKIGELLVRAARGFTIIETLIAVLLLSTAIAGPLTLAAKGLTTALAAKDQFIAFYLAQDAIEYIRYARDTNKLSGGDWLTGMNGGTEVGIDVTPCESANGCELDSRGLGVLTGNSGDASIAACASTPCPTLVFDASTGAYNYVTGTAQGTPQFVRTVRINAVSATEITLTATMSWREPSGARSVTVTEELFDWE